MGKGNLFVISGPSGTGKGTLIKRLLSEVPEAWLSISATTRPPRSCDREGQTYYFLTRDEFLKLVDEGGFLEWAEFAGNLYGTPLKSVREKMGEGAQVVLEIDVQGASQVRALAPDAKLVFIEPPSFEELERRLRSRGTDSEEVIRERLEVAKVELSRKEEYDIQLVNDDLDEAAAQLVAYVREQADES